jgi:hypothetical protein
VRAIEGKKFTVWTVLQTRKDTGEITTEIRFQDPKGTLKGASSGDDDADGDEAPASERQPRGGKKPAAKTTSRRR